MTHGNTDAARFGFAGIKPPPLQYCAGEQEHSKEKMPLSSIETPWLLLKPPGFAEGAC
jgi:hypothetical protein